MPIVISLPDDLFDTDQTARLKTLFDAATDEDFTDALTKVACAALTEYRDMFLGMPMASRADEIRQHRLFHLTKYFFSARLPSEAEVSAMFQLAQSQARSLIRNVMTRFRYHLEVEVRNTLSSVIDSAHATPGGSYQATIQSDNVVDELNRIIGINAPGCDPVAKVRNMARVYTIAPDSNQALRTYLGLPPLP